MKENDKEPQFQSGKTVNKSTKGLYGLDPGDESAIIQLCYDG